MAEQRAHSTTRPFLAGVLGFTVQCSSAAVRDVVDALFVDLAEPPPEVELQVLRLDEVELDGTPMLELSGCRGLNPGVALAPDVALDMLVSRLNRLSLDADPDRLHLHAAAVAKRGRGVLISAPGGTGKTTLAAALVSRSWDYLTDEMVALAPGDPAMTGFAKPLTIKQSGRSLFADLEQHRVAFGPSAGTSWHVPVSGLGGRPIRCAVPAFLVFLSRDAESTTAEPAWAPLHRADSVVALMQESMDVGRFGSGALALVAEVAGRCQAVQVEAGAPHATAAMVAELLAEATGSDRRQSGQLTRDTRSEYASEFTVTESVVSVELDDRVVVHDLRTGKLASFDEAGSAMWLALHGRAPGDRRPPQPDSPGVRAFLGSLEREGLVTRDDS